jgi:glutamate dehydrogenase/leucine dehydrogenase
MDLDETCNPWLEASLQLEEVAQRLDLEDSIVQRLRHPEREVTVNLPLVCDHGRAATFTGFRVQHSTARGPTLGGVSLSPDAHLAQVRAAAMINTWQLALLEIPFGGSAGAIVCDPTKLSERELRHLSHDYVRALRGVVGPHVDILRQDAGCNERILAWMLDEHAHGAGRLEPAAVANKPSALFGLGDQATAGAKGVLWLLEAVAGEHGWTLPGLRVVIQGFGQLGRTLAMRLREAGAHVVALADGSGGIYSEGGLDVPVVAGWVEREGMLFGYGGGEAMRNADVLEMPCEVLVTADGERQITSANAGQIHAKLVIEAVLHATSMGAQQILTSRNVTVIPDVLATGGTAAQAYLEWTLNTCDRVLLTGEAEEHLKRRILQAWRAVRETAATHGVGLRMAAHLRAVEQVAAALRLR